MLANHYELNSEERLLLSFRKILFQILCVNLKTEPKPLRRNLESKYWPNDELYNNNAGVTQYMSSNLEKNF